MDQSSLPPAARLAALIEAGRVANPDLKHERCDYRKWSAFPELTAVCAVSMAILGAGVSRRQFGGAPSATSFFDTALAGIPVKLLDEVSAANIGVNSFEDICLSLREGELAKVTT
jgi:hypothetical protein